MTKTRRMFTDDFKREAVALLESSGRPLMQVAAELGIQPSMLRGWRGAANGSKTSPTALLQTPALSGGMGLARGRLVMSDFKGRHFTGEIVLWAVRWYCRYGVSYRDLEELRRQRSVKVERTTFCLRMRRHALSKYPGQSKPDSCILSISCVFCPKNISDIAAFMFTCRRAACSPQGFLT